jgi:c-di-GMP-binding flagellar brake protein YcgR
MLGFIKRIFSRNQLLHDFDPELSPKTKLPSSSFITDPEKILKLLNGVEQQTPLCTISFNSIKEVFTTTILEIQSTKSIIIFDQLSPSQGNDLIKKKHSLKISAQFNHISFAFKLTRITTDTANGIIYYKATLPQKIYYPQKREAFRFSTRPYAIRFQGLSSQSLTIAGNLADISAVGVGIVILDHRIYLQHGEKLSNCSINLPENDSINFDLAIRFVKSIRCDTKLQFGGYFENLSPQDENKLKLFIGKLTPKEVIN